MASNKFYSERDLWKSQVFRSLTKASILVYQDFRMKCKFQRLKGKSGRQDNWIITNNGEIEYTYSAAEKEGFTRPRFMRAITELVDKGFIDITHSGSGGVKGDKNQYAISERWRDWGTENFIEKSRSRDTRGGRGFDVYWKKKRANIGNASVTLPSNKNVNP